MNSIVLIYFILTFLVIGIYCDARGWVDPSDPYADRPASTNTKAGYVCCNFNLLNGIFFNNVTT